MPMRLPIFAAAVFLTWFGMQMLVRADEPALTAAAAAPKAFIDGTGQSGCSEFLPRFLMAT